MNNMIVVVDVIMIYFSDELFNNNRIYKEMFSIEHIW